MLKNYFLTAWRHIRKNRAYSIINIAGLSIGMAACIVILLFVSYENSFDEWHTKNIYRLNEVQKFPGMVASQKVALTMYPMAATMKQEFPEIKNFTHVRWRNKYQLTQKEQRIFLPQAIDVDSIFFQFFDFPLLKGDPATVLQKPNSIVLTESTAHRLFGNEDPIGKTVNHYGGDTVLFMVTGIVKDIPENSQLQFDAVISQSTFYKPNWMDRWGGNWLNTYFELAPNTDIAALEKKFPAYLRRHMDEEGAKMYQLFLLPYKQVHANAADIGLDYVNYHKFDRQYTRLFLIVALIVLVIACINFMNLATARSAERAKEVGIRKSIGALRFQLGVQFLGETVLLSLLALIMAAILVALSLPFVNEFSQRHLEIQLYNHPSILVWILAATVIVGLLSGLYPAVYLSAFQPVKVLKGTIQVGKSKGLLRNVLVVGQFVSAIFLIIATIFVFRQLNFMQQKDPGFNRDQVVNIPLDAVTYRKYALFKQDLTGSPLIAGVTAAQDDLGSHLDQSGIEFKGDGPLRRLTGTRLIVDPDYLKLYHIALVAGHDFRSDSISNGHDYIINETMARELLRDMPGKPMQALLGKRFGFDSSGVIAGIAKDFNFNSLHYKIETMFLFNQKDWGFSTVSVKLSGGNVKEGISLIESTWKRIFPGHPMEYQFLDDHFAEVYRTDAQVSKMVGVLAGLAIFISCLGLFGLASYAAEQRVKEIGIRKVLGASIQSIVFLLSRHFIILVLIANIIAWPLAWLTIDHWLQDYAYRIPISWWVFALAGGLALLIALLTVSTLAARAANANPMKSLKTE